MNNITTNNVIAFTKKNEIVRIVYILKLKSTKMFLETSGKHAWSFTTSVSTSEVIFLNHLSIFLNFTHPVIVCRFMTLVINFSANYLILVAKTIYAPTALVLVSVKDLSDIHWIHRY